MSRCVSENRLPPTQTNKEMQLDFFKKQGEQKLSSICRFHPYGPLLWKKRVAERRAIMAASIFGSSFVPLPGVFRG